MTSETISKIFDPFFTTKFTGRGLGLAAVLGIVRGHSGALRVHSELHRGSTFTLILPPTTAEVPRNENMDTPLPWRAAGRVLVIDDEDTVRDVAAALLRTFGFIVTAASNGADGIELFRHTPFDIILLDLTMPDMNGEETLARLRILSSTVPVLLISGYSENDRIAQLSASGPLLFLQKPFTRGSLEQKLRVIVEQYVAKA
jgi:CheY-like chemotaxis protein